MERSVRFQCLAGLFAAADVFVGFKCFSVGALLDPMNLALFIVPNCALSVAFIIRCVHAARDAYRRALWRASAIVHGIWLAVSATLAIVMAFTLKGTMEIGFFGACWFAWLIIAVVLSLYGLRYDNGGAA